MPIWAVKCTAGREIMLADKIEVRAKKMGLDIYAVFVPPNIKGFVFVEAETYDDVLRSVYGDRNFKGMIKEPIPIEEMKGLLGIKEIEIEVNPGDIVELISGPFKGEQARVVRVDKGKKEVTIELLDAAIPVQITVKMDSITVLRRKGE